jgi:spore germination cell wall hydrolase CwlJ-like protein
LTLLAATVFLEAEGEPPEGQLGVAWVVRNRVDRWRQDWHDVILAPWQFSCWNPSERPRALARLGQATPQVSESCWRAAAGAIWRLLPTPVEDATHYLNVTLTRAGRPRRDLPKWAADPSDPTRVNSAKVVCVLGRHTFLRG